MTLPPIRRRILRLAIAIAALAALLASCGGPASGPTDPDAGIFVPEHAFGGPVPEGAERLGAEAFRAAAAADDFRWEGAAVRAVREAAAAEQLAADRAVVDGWIARAPELARFAEPPDVDADPALEASRGSYLYTFENRAGATQTVATLGTAAVLRDLVAAQESYEDPANQLAVYRAGYTELPAAARGDLPPPDSLESASLTELLAANAQLEAALAGEVEALERGALAELGRPAPQLGAQGPDAPPGFPELPADEERSGAGGDRRGDTCGRAAGGLYLNLTWPQKYFTTSTKNQGRRGSCVAFALTSAAETQVAVREARWMNLSEQYLYNRMKSLWDPEDYDDGADTVDSAETFHDSDYRLPYEDMWNYNPSFSRIDGAGDGYLDFQGSCVGYDERCSDTTHQGQFLCAVVADEVYCGSRPPNLGGVGRRMDAVPLTLWTNTPWSNGLPISLLRALLASGHPVIASIEVAAGFDDDRLDPNGFLIDYGDESRGGHAVHVTGYVGNGDLAAALPEAPPAQGGGYLIVKNSWGTCFGDGGLVYVPLAWAERFFKNLVVFTGLDPSDAFANTPPEVEITAPADGAALPQGAANAIAFRAAVADAEDGATCCTIGWRSDLDGYLGDGAEIEAGLTSPGSHVITVTATDGFNASDSDSVTVEVVNAAPVPTILAPAPGEEIPVGIPYTLQGSATDLGNLGVPCSQLSWTSSAASDPYPLPGCNPQVTFQTMGVRTLTLTVVDDFGASASASVEFVVVPAPDLWASITTPKPNDLFLQGSPVDLSGVIAQDFELPATFTWNAYAGGRTDQPVVVAQGDVFLVQRTGSKLVPDTSWNPSDDGVGTGELALELVIEGANGSAASARIPISIAKLQ